MPIISASEIPVIESTVRDVAPEECAPLRAVSMVVFAKWSVVELLKE